MKTIVRTRCY